MHIRYAGRGEGNRKYLWMKTGNFLMEKGHGISGMHVLSTLSMLSTGAMFGGGIVTAFILYYAGAYQNSLQGWM